ncbi:MAG: hypothetical protein JWR24_2035 [Actinoallomurus sp.]|jgi:hypothetical protein|nr:hypothetical protein [Actinoallomurus sp.]
MRRTALTLLPLATAFTMAGCGSGDSPKAARTPSGDSDCGKVATAGEAQAELKVTKGSASCAEARSVFQAFFAEVAGGKAPGQGSGGRLTVQGWSCVIYPPDRIQQKGRGADCAKAGTTVTAFQGPG